MGRTYIRYWGKERCIQVLMGNVRKRPLERPCRRWEDDIKVDF